MVACVIALKLWWKRSTPPQQSVDKPSEKAIIDAEYTVVEKE